MNVFDTTRRPPLSAHHSCVSSTSLFRALPHTRRASQETDRLTTKTPRAPRGRDHSATVTEPLCLGVFVLNCSLLEGKDALPVVLHADDRPALLLRLVIQRLGE